MDINFKFVLKLKYFYVNVCSYVRNWSFNQYRRSVPICFSSYKLEMRIILSSNKYVTAEYNSG